MAKFISALFFSLLLVGCQTTSQQLATNSFKFEAEKMQVKEAVVATFVSRGYQVSNDSDFILAFDRPIDNNFAAQMLLGSTFNSVPNARVTFTFTGSSPTTVVSNLSAISNPGSGFEKTVDMNNNADGRAVVEKAMLEVRQKLNAS
ncbi:MAG: hypothetical protein JJ979_25905 [Roseibium sp.]|nr:hypothetical protein [Roseibium sp.]